jgi:ClpP class serine protease
MKGNALKAAMSVVWAMEERALETVLEIAAREHDVTEEALEAYSAKSLANSQRARVRDGVAIIEANGAMFRRANLMTAISGATSYDVLRADLQAALDDPAVKAINLVIDSPGGEVNGANELAQAIYDARGTKPIIAYVGGSGASRGLLGCIGRGQDCGEPHGGARLHWRSSRLSGARGQGR